MPVPPALRPRPALLVSLTGTVLVGVALYLWWPLGVALGLAVSVLVVLAVGRQQARAARAVEVDDLFGLAAPEPARPAAADPEPSAAQPGVRADLDRLKADLGDDYPDFARAARLVVSTQYASAARLQRDLHLPYSRARRLLADLETEHFVGPATGALPRQVLLPRERLAEVEQLFAGV